MKSNSEEIRRNEQTHSPSRAAKTSLNQCDGGVGDEVSQAVHSNILVVSGVPHCVTDSLWFGSVSKVPMIKHKMLLPLLL